MRRVAKSLVVAAGLVIVILFALVLNIRTPTPQGNKLTVVASFFPLYDWASNVVGNKANVTSLTPPGMDPHDLDPTPQDISKIVSSSVFIYSGAAGMEPWAPKVLPTLNGSRTIIVDVTQGIQLMHGQTGQTDPHFWLNPVLAVAAVKNIELAFEKADPDNSGYYRQNAQTYIARLNALNQAFLGNFTSVRIRTFITFHTAFQYWKSTYNLTEVGIYGFEPEGEPSAAHMQDLLNLAKSYQITTVLASDLDDPHWCQVLADQIGGKVLILDPLEGPTLDQARMGNYTYIGRLYYDMSVLKVALA